MQALPESSFAEPHIATTTQVTIRLLLPITAIAALTLMALAGFLWWSAERVDATDVEQQRLLLARGLEQQQTQMVVAQTGVAIWDDSVDAVNRRDIDWLVENLGTYHYDAYKYDRAVVVDHQLNPIMYVVDGYAVPPDAARGEIDAISTMFSKLRDTAGEAHVTAFNADTRMEAPYIQAFTHFERRPSLVAIMPILSFSRQNTPAPGTESYLVSVMFLDSDLAADMGDQYRLNRAAFVEPNEAPAEGSASLPILNADGATIALMVWSPDDPGTGLLRSAFPAMMAALAIVILLALMLLRSLYLALWQLRAEREEASHNALHDPLTGLGNRALFHARLAAVLRNLPPGKPRVALLALDLDRFKHVNDTLGHAAGDELLRQVADRLTNTLNSGDTLARVGGDEFAIIQPDIASTEQSVRLAKTIIEELSKPIELTSGLATIGVSVGIATAPDCATTEDDLKRLADDALYLCKGEGRNRYHLNTRHASETSRRV